jgi:putative tricarboxylic transport membrane protein
MEILIYLFNLKTLIIVFLGTLGGVIIGVLPGLSGPTGVALLLPFTFTLDPAAGLLMLGGIYMGSSYGGSVSAILLNAPGTSYAAASALDGFPLAKQGRAKEALLYSLEASVVGGIVGVGALILFAPFLASIALKFGPPEMFLLATAGLAIIGVLAGENIFKGIAAGALGVLISTVGPDIMTGYDRLTFGIKELESGIPLIPALVGLFAVSEMIGQSIRIGHMTLVDIPMKKASITSIFKKIFSKNWLLITKTSILGTLIGIMPGAGAAVSSFIAYGEAKRGSKDPGSFGKGNVEGLIAAESANNASVGGALVPLLALGIPGSCTTAILYGALTIHGLIPGPRLFMFNTDVVYPFMTGMLLTVFFMGLIGVLGANYFSRVIHIKFKYLVAIILVLCFLGAYSIRNSVFDILLAVIFGVLGLFFKWINLPVAPIVLGVILGPIGEEGIRQTLVITSAQKVSLISYFVTRPISVILFLLLLGIIYTSFKAFFKLRGASECEIPIADMETTEES